MYQLTKKEEARIKKIIIKERFSGFEFVSKGFSSLLFKAWKNKNCFALKIEREKSSRQSMIERECIGLKTANKQGIGPKLFKANKKDGYILMEYINGKTFEKWISENHEKKDVWFVVKKLYLQSKKLDEIKLRHSQLAGKGKNILVFKKNKRFFPVIIDFEKSGFREKPGNVSQISSFLWRNENSFIAQKLVFLFGKKWWEKL